MTADCLANEAVMEPSCPALPEPNKRFGAPASLPCSVRLLRRLSALPFTKAVAKPVWRYDEEDFVGSVTVAVNTETSLLFFQAVRLQFREGRFDTINLKEASFLTRVTSIFSQADLNPISCKGRRLVRRFLP